jgi:hypothetical protein
VPEVISSTRSCSTCTGRCWWCPPAKRHYPDNRCYAAGSSGDLQVLSPARSLAQTLVRLRHLRARVRACSNAPPNAGRAGSSSSLWAWCQHDIRWHHVPYFPIEKKIWNTLQIQQINTRVVCVDISWAWPI